MFSQGFSISLTVLTLAACTAPLKSEPSSTLAPSFAIEADKEILAKNRSAYPSDQYLIGIGRGHSEKAAAELARADLMKQVRVEVKVRWSDFLREIDGRTEQEVTRHVDTQVAELVNGVEIVEQGTDANTAMAYAVAVLPKAEMAKILEGVKAKNEFVQAPLEPLEQKGGVWVQAEGIVTLAEDTTIAEAKARSRDEARRKAIEKAVGVFVKGQTVVYNAQVADDLVRSLVRGLIVEEQILEEGLQQVGEPSAPKALLYATKLKAKVKPVRVERRGDFVVRAELNKTVFYEGDEMQIRAVATRDAYLHVFNVGQDDTVTVLLPSKYARVNFAPAQKEFLFPDEEQRNAGIRLRAFPPAGARKALEKIKLIATTKPIDLTHGKIPEGSFQVYQGRDTTLVTDLLKTLSLLDEAEWTEITLTYELRR